MLKKYPIRVLQTLICILMFGPGMTCGLLAAVPGPLQLLADTDAPICPATTYDLSRLVSGATPAGSTLRFYTSASPSQATLVADPSAVPAGNYYGRYESAGGDGPISQPITITSCQTPFVCRDGIAYQVGAEDGEPVSSLYSFNVMTGVRTFIDSLSSKVNALVYNPSDNMLWACKTGDTGILVRIDAAGASIEYPITGLTGRFNAGAILPDSYMLVYEANSTSYYVIDINPLRATYLRLIDPATGNATMTGKTISEAINVGDLVHRPSTGWVYGIETSTARLTRLDYKTGVVTRGPTVLSLPRNTTFGAIFADLPDRMFVFANETHSSHRITLSDNTSYQVARSVVTSSNDGASCPYAILEIERANCSENLVYQVSSAAEDTASTLFTVSVSTVFKFGAKLSMNVSSLIMRQKDRILWGTKKESGSVVRLARQVALEYPVPNLPVTTYDAAVEIPEGYMLVYASMSQRYYVIDIDQTRSTFLRLVDPTNGFALKTGPDFGTALSTPLDVGDLVFVPSTQLCYGVMAGRLATLNPFTGEVTMGAPIRGIGSGTFGSMFVDWKDQLYGFQDSDNYYYQIDREHNTAFRMSGLASSTGNDGAGCSYTTLSNIYMTAPVPEIQTCIDASATFSITHSGAEPMAFQWWVSTNGGKDWNRLNGNGATDINGSYSGAGSAVLKLNPKTTAWNGNRYRIVFRGEGEFGDLTSPESTLIVRDVPSVPTLARATTRPLCPEATADLTTLVTSAPPAGDTLRFYTTEIPSPTTLVAHPGNAGPGTYFAFYANPGCSSPASELITVDDDCGVLPVSLAAFSVVKEGNGSAILSWVTTEESNSDHFEIERSMDTRTWVKIGEKLSHGESKDLKRYDFTDGTPAAGINYYRLKMVDKDATFTYSRIQYVKFDDPNTLVVYPEPANDRIKFTNFGEVREVTFYNSSGVKVLELRSVSAEGVDIAKLVPGIYSVSLLLKDDSTTTRKVIVAR